MFYALVGLGIVFIIVGVYNYKPEEKNRPDEGKEFQESLREIEIDDLKYRIENLEKEFSSQHSKSFQEVIEDSELAYSSIDNYKKVLQYEEENLSIEEISELLDMKKGEVLLLKNLYKNQKD